MKKSVSSSLLTILIVFFISVSGFAQPIENEIKGPVKITMNNGEVYIGEILSDDGRETLIETKTVGKLYLKKSEIAQIKKINQQEAESQEADPVFDEDPAGFTARYQLSPNALPLKKGTGYTAINLYGPELHYTVMDNLTINLATSWIASPFTVSLKYTLPINSDVFHLGIGTRIGSSAYLNKFRGYGGNLWLTGTIGNHEDNISLSYGYGYADLGMKNNNYSYIPGQYDGNDYYYSENAFGNDNYTNLPIQDAGPQITQGSYFSLGARKTLSRKVSLTFDATVYISSSGGSNQKVNLDNSNPSAPIITVTDEFEKVTIAYFMPGVRFELSEGKAFQVSLSGYYLNRFITINDGLPIIPMCTWYFRI
ncbi:hypothetical protein [Crocinitomix catalasitica]|uniref:hypothetical protein n=1 Tax=Crocinitomix catalasitica TaxID=184607 RepID=UPI000483C52F|nr:hypothetical protein [Crocinitomix catalasitica]